jgi:hypothetical protein
MHIDNARQFVVPCNLLNDEIGKDRIFIRVYATSSIGAEMCMESDIVKDSF